MMVTCRREERAHELAGKYGVRRRSPTPRPRVGQRLVLTVKPQDMEALLAQIGGHVTPDDLVVTFAAGIRTSFIEKHLRRTRARGARDVERPGAGGRGDVVVIAAGPAPADKHLVVAEELLGGREGHPAAREAPGRRHGDERTGPAYFFLLAEAMIEACILLGLSRDVATELIIQTMLGSAKMLRDTGKHPVELREMVTSPGGTTIAAIRILEEAGVRAAFLNAIDAACKRGMELAQGGDDDEE